MEWQLGGGVIVLVAVVLWLVYLLPSWHSRHLYNASERNAVRLNQALRVLAETSETPGEVHLELNARTAAAQQRLARRAKAAEAEAELEEARRQLEIARSLPGARRARARRRARAVTTFAGLSALGLAGWGAWEVVTTGSQLALWAGVGVAVVCAMMLTRMARVRGRVVERAVEATPVVERRTAAVAAPEVLEDRGWMPRSLPRPLVASAGSRAASELDAAAARQALEDAARREELRVRAEELRPAPPDIAAARAAREEESPYARMGFVDDAEIEDHVRRLLARRAAG